MMADYWSWNNAVDGNGSTIESSEGSSGDLVTSNLRDPRVGKIWRAGDMPVDLTINLAASSGVSIIGLFGVNFAELTTVSLALYDDVTLVWSEEITDLTGSQAVFLFLDDQERLEPINASQLIISATGTLPLEIGRVWVGTADWEPEFGHTINGSGRRVLDLSNITRAPNTGARIADRNERRRIFTANYDALSQTEFDETLHEIDVERGLASQMLFIPHPGVYSLKRGPILGALVELEEIRFTQFLTAERTLTIQEDG